MMIYRLFFHIVDAVGRLNRGWMHQSIHRIQSSDGSLPVQQVSHGPL